MPIEVPAERKRVRFTFPTCPKSGRTVIELTDVRKAYGEKVVFERVSLLVERGDRIALVAPNGAGKSTLMRMIAGVEAPDAGLRREGHQVVMQYFAQDEASRLEPSRTVYETMEADSPVGMVPMIRNILGGFLFAGDDIYKRAGVLSGGERTRLAVARMLLRPANTLILDEPTNHLDLDSKDVLLNALEDFGGTLIFVSHDRYFVDKLANKVVSVGHGTLEVYPGGYEAFLWSRTQRAQSAKPDAVPVPPTRSKGNAATPSKPGRGTSHPSSPPLPPPIASATYADKKKADADSRRRQKAADERARRVRELEQRIAEREQLIKDLEAQMAAPGFYDVRETAEAVINRHQTLMWEVGDLMNQWEGLQAVGDGPE